MNIIAIHDGDGPLRGSEKVLLDLMTGLAARQHSWLLLTNHVEMYTAAIGAGFAAELLPFKRLLIDQTSVSDWWQSWRCFKRLRQIIRIYKPQVIHINNGGACQWAVPAGASLGVPTLVHLHAPWSRKMRFLMGLHHPDCVVGVSSAIVHPISADPVAAPKVRVIYNGIADRGVSNKASRSTARRAMGLTDEQFVVAFVGVLIPAKRAQDAINAIRLLSDENCILLIIGNGPYMPQLKKLADGLPILFLGNRPDVQDLMRDVCDAVILPSEIEAFSLVLLEAAICGLPRIASDAGGNIESIQHMQDGLIVPLGEISGFADSISRLMIDKSLGMNLGKQARARAIDLFSCGVFLDSFESLYHSLGVPPSVNLFGKIISILRSNFVLIRGSAS